MKIEELIEKNNQLRSEIFKNEIIIDSILMDYHKKLIDCNFYKEYTLDGLSLDKKFWIRPYSLPEADHGEGDYIRIDFDIDDIKLKLLYSCSYRHEEDECLISIPLEIMEGEVTILNDFIIEEVIKKEELLKSAKLKQIQKNKIERIAVLEKELKTLKS